MLNNTLQTFAGLQCRVLDLLPKGQPPSHLIVVCHGFGASMDDLASFAPYLFQTNTATGDRCRFVFPNAPMDLGPLGMPGGRAWWEINMARLAMINQTRNYQELTTVVPDGLIKASQQLADAVREMQTTFELNDASTTLAGFSQGAMISTDLVLRHNFVPQRLCIFSGMLICADDWTKFAQRHTGCPVLQSHGRYDMVLPFEPAESLRDMLTASGFDVTFLPFDADHTIPIDVLDHWAALL
ncbi:MAG: hypothetical protein R3C59_28920 [Planctomycetaceae bacterium]